MPLPQRVNQPTRDTLATQFHANYGSGPAAQVLADITADRQRMPRFMVRSLLRKVTDLYAPAAATLDGDVVRGVTPIADGATDTITETVAGVPKSLTYSFVNTGNTLFTIDDFVAGAQTNCVVSIDSVWLVGQPSIGVDGGIVANADSAESPVVTPVSGTLNVDVTVTPTAAGAWSFTLSTPTNVVAKDPYNWTVDGTAVAAAPEMDVLVGVNPLANGGTDTVAGTIEGIDTVHSYIIDNTGGLPLTLSAPVLDNFVNCTAVVSAPLTSPVAEFGTTGFSVTVTPTAAGAWSYTVSVANNDSDENPYDWTVDGVAAVAASEMDVTVGVNPLADGGTDTIAGTIEGIMVQQTYTIENTGNIDLTLVAPVIDNFVNCTATVSTAVVSPVAPAGTTSLVLDITPTAAGAWSFDVSLANNDADENPYNWTTDGVAAAAASEMDVLVGVTPLASGGTDTVLGTTSGVLTPQTYTINNTGNVDLTFAAAVISNLVNCTAVVSTAAVSPIAAAGTDDLIIDITPTLAGAWSFDVSIANNDADENPYTWTTDGVAA